MRIDQLDEYQGLEAQMVRDWMISRGCYRQDGYWRHPREQYHYTDGEYGGLLWEGTLVELSVDFGLSSVQALLREINPRMRKGVPSQEAITAHGGTWMAAPPLGRNGIVFVNLRVLLDPSWAEWSFWPCDDHGNKVLWPTDANGEML